MAPGEGRRSNLWAQVGFYTSLGFILPAGAVAGYGLGWLIDDWLHTTPVVAIVMALLGAGGGFIEVLRILNRAERDGGGDDSGTGAS
jgi:F0F1-type ATP synthase assembly protein I